MHLLADEMQGIGDDVTGAPHYKMFAAKNGFQS